MLALTLVLALTVPVALFLLWDRGGSDTQSDKSLPISTFSDDKFRTVGNTPPTKTHPQSPTPSKSPTPSDTPSESPTQTPSETDPPTAEPSETVAPTRIPTRATTGPASKPTRTPSTTAPTQPTTTAPPPPPDDGGMSAQEQELFNLIDNARVDNGCGRLGRKTSLTKSARGHASSQAQSGGNSTGDGTEAISSSSSARSAFNDMMDNYSDVLLDCGRKRLGIGYAESPSGCVLGVCLRTNRRWVADFDR